MPAEQRRRSRAVDDALLDWLRHEPLEPIGRIAGASNATLLSRLGDDGTLVIYKPQRGEAPLWDFPDGTLHRREVAAFWLDRLLGWGMVPPTVLREDGPLGRGSVQLFIEHDPERHYFVLVTEEDDAIADDLARMVVFDIVANNADRKGSHVLADADDHLWLVDHGVCFHADAKLRTVAWDFAGEAISPTLRGEVADAARLLEGDTDRAARMLRDLLDPLEVDALMRRLDRARRLERFPPPQGPRPLPWPPL